MVTMEVEVVDSNLNYNILLRSSWKNVMVCVVSTLFRLLHFPHQGKIVTMDQLDFFPSESSVGNIPYVGKAATPYENIGLGLLKYSSLMGVFLLPLLPLNVASINMISSGHYQWIVPNLDQIESFGDNMPLSTAKQMYQDIITTYDAASETNTHLVSSLYTYA